jgi:hypothetical protein
MSTSFPTSWELPLLSREDGEFDCHDCNLNGNIVLHTMHGLKNETSAQICHISLCNYLPVYTCFDPANMSPYSNSCFVHILVLILEINLIFYITISLFIVIHVLSVHQSYVVTTLNKSPIFRFTDEQFGTFFFRRCLL